MGEIIDKMKGKAKQVQGSITGDRGKQVEGFIEEKKGDAKGLVEEAKNAVRKP